MKLNHVLASASSLRSLTLGGPSASSSSSSGGKDGFKKLELEKPLNWLPGPRLFPANVIAGFNAELSQYDAESWADYVLEQCTRYSACTSTASYQATNSGSTGGRYWFGYLFRGGPTTSEDYERHDAVEDSIVYTLSDEDFAALKKAGDL